MVERRLPRVLELASRKLYRGVFRSREIAAGSASIFGGRAKVNIGCVMLAGGRKMVCGYVMINIGWREDYCGLLFYILRHAVWRYQYVMNFFHACPFRVCYKT